MTDMVLVAIVIRIVRLVRLSISTALSLVISNWLMGQVVGVVIGTALAVLGNTGVTPLQPLETIRESRLIILPRRTQSVRYNDRECAVMKNSQFV